VVSADPREARRGLRNAGATTASWLVGAASWIATPQGRLAMTGEVAVRRRGVLGRLAAPTPNTR